MVAMVLALAAMATGTNTTPYAEDFEGYSRGFSLAGTNGWEAGAGSSAVITDTEMGGTFRYFYPLNTNHDFNLNISGWVTNRVQSPSGTHVWVDMLMPAMNQRVYVGGADGTEYFSFVVTNSGKFIVHHSFFKAGARQYVESTTTNVTVGEREWIRVTLDQDYSATSSNMYNSFRILANGRALTGGDQYTNNIELGQPRKNLGGTWFAMLESNTDAMGMIWVKGTNGTGCLDDLVVKTNTPDFSAIARGQVSISGVDTNAEVMGFKPGICRVTLDSGPTNRYIFATYITNGTAAPGGDYMPLSSVVGIPPGATNADIQVIPRRGPAGDREVTITLVSNVYTTVGTSSSAVVRIWNDVEGSATSRQKEPSSRRTGLIISEIMYHPATRADGRDGEFVELYNTEPVDVDIGGYRLTGEISYTFPTGTVLNARSCFVVAKDPNAHLSTPDVMGPFTGSLDNNGGVVRLKNAVGAVLLEAAYSSAYPWPASADGAGHSLTLVKPDYGEGDIRAWSAGSRKGGTPGWPDSYRASAYDGLVINEFVAHTDQPLVDSIELYNASSNSINLLGCWLSDDAGTNRYRITNGAALGPRAFTNFTKTNFLFELSAGGGGIYMVSSNNDMVIDAVKYAAQSNGASCGRYPDGTAGFQTLVSLTLGGSNASPWTGSIVINEIMYHPISGNDDDQYIELFNRGPGTVNVGYWRFTDGIDYTIPAGTTIGSSNYLVIAKNVTNLLAKYPGQLGSWNTVGPFNGRLSHGGERLVLAKPDDLDLPLQDYVIQDEVTYSDGWGDWTDGGGSSLELKDPRSDNRLEMNWAGSDETQKTTNLWTLVSFTGTVHRGFPIQDDLMPPHSPNELCVALLDAGECLVDDVAVSKNGGANLLANGTFESGTGDWFSEWYRKGNHINSRWETGEGRGGGKSLHLAATGDGNNGPDCIESIDFAGLAENDTNVTLRCWARWLCGHRGLLLHLAGNYLEAVGALSVPSNLGTPGARNSRYAANTGPAISDVAHSPVLPGASENIVVEARVFDPDGISSMSVVYRLGVHTGSPGSPITNAMNDAGTNGDRIARDGVYSVTITGRPANEMIGFYVEARDAHAVCATNRFPSAAPASECLVLFGQTNMPGVYGTYRIWITEANRSTWAGRPRNSNQYLDATIVRGDCRAIYEGGAKWRGSPWVRPSGDPESTAGQNLAFRVPSDDPLLGSTTFSIDGFENGRDTTYQRERMCFRIGEWFGVPAPYQRYAHVYVNEVRKASNLNGICGDNFQPNWSYIESWYPDDEGELFEIDDWFEFDDSSERTGNCEAEMHVFTAVEGGRKQCRYRWSWQKKTRSAYDDYWESLLILADNMDLALGDTYDKRLSALVDYESFMRTFAIRRIVADWDGWGYNRGKNTFLYKPLKDRWKLLVWDLDFALGAGSDGSSTDLFSPMTDPGLSGRFFANSRFRRAYWRAMQEAVDGILAPENCEPLMSQQYDAHLSNGVSGAQSPFTASGMRDWIVARRAYIAGQLNAVTNVAFDVTTAGFGTSVSPVTISGTAPVKVSQLNVNGCEHPVRWTAQTTWEVVVAVSNGVNVLQFAGYDRLGALYGTDSVTVTNGGVIVLPDGYLVINEIMYNSLKPNGGFVEIFNRSTNLTFHLGGLRMEGVDFTFGAGTFIGPTGYVVVAGSIPGYQCAYSNAEVVAGEFSGTLDNGGETLRLLRPEVSGGVTNWIEIDRVTYDDDPPWPVVADGGGASLQLKDATNDNNRVGNWAADTNVWYTPGMPNSVTTSLPAFDLVWINEVMPANAMYTNNLGAYAPWTELYNAGTNKVALGSGYYLSDSYSNLTRWAFPGGTVITNGTQLLVWCDGGVSVPGWLHAGFVMNSSSGSVVLARVSGAQTTIVDYVNYSGIVTNRSYGMYPEGQQYSYQVFRYPTPGGSNNPAWDMPAVFINEWMADNKNVNMDACVKKHDWFELYNASNSAVDLNGFQLAGSSNGTNRCTVPGGCSIPGNGFLLVWADDAHPVKMDGGALYVNFGLKKNGDTIWLFTPDGTMLDKVKFDQQLEDVGEGRWPDGSGNIYQMPFWTPVASNRLFRVTSLARSNDTAILEWSSRSGRQYQVKWSTSMLSSVWTPLSNLVANGELLSTNLTGVGSWTTRFFRVYEVK